MKYVFPWQEQFNRIKRLRDDLKRFESSADSNFEKGVDAFTSFFIQCYHLSDWLVKSGQNKDLVWKFIKESQWLSLCRNLANTQKHQGRPVNEFIDFDDFSFGITTPISRYIDHLTNQTRFCIDTVSFGPLPLDAMACANKCIEEWEKYLAIYIKMN